MIKNKTYIIALLLALLGIGLYSSTYINSLKNDISHWQNEAAKLRGQVEIAENTYESQSIVLKEIKLDNKKLTNRIKETDRDVYYYTKLSLKYRTKIDSIESTPYIVLHDTTDTSSVSISSDIKSRAFHYASKNQIDIKGRFQIESPYRLFITDLSFLMHIGIAVSQYEDGTWWSDIDTGSPELRPEQVSVSIKPYGLFWEYYIGGKVGLYGSTPSGIGFVAGIKRGSYSGDIGYMLIAGAPPTTTLGFTKYFRF